jgi:hypothetical protein
MKRVHTLISALLVASLLSRKYIAMAFLAAFTLTNCGNDDPCEGVTTRNYTETLNQFELEKAPYTGFDTLYFLNKEGDTCITKGTGKQVFVEQRESLNMPGCPPSSITKSNAYKIEFVPIKGNLAFDFIMSKQNGSVKVIHKFNTRANEPYFELELFLLGQQNMTWKGFTDTLVINSQKYGRVYQALVKQFNVYLGDSTYKSYINQSHGVLHLSSVKDNMSFSIIKKL